MTFTALHNHRVPYSKEAGDGPLPAVKGHHQHATSPQVATNLWDPGHREWLTYTVARRTCAYTAVNHLARGARAPFWGAIRGLTCPIAARYHRDSCSGMVTNTLTSCWVHHPWGASEYRLAKMAMCFLGAFAQTGLH